MTESSCELRGKCFIDIIKELLNWYWWILALVGFKMHSQARAFLQPTRANIHQYQFNNPIVYMWPFVLHLSFIIFHTLYTRLVNIMFGSFITILMQIWFQCPFASVKCDLDLLYCCIHISQCRIIEYIAKFKCMLIRNTCFALNYITYEFHVA